MNRCRETAKGNSVILEIVTRKSMMIVTSVVSHVSGKSLPATWTSSISGTFLTVSLDWVFMLNEDIDATVTKVEETLGRTAGGDDRGVGTFEVVVEGVTFFCFRSVILSLETSPVLLFTLQIFLLTMMLPFLMRRKETEDVFPVSISGCVSSKLMTTGDWRHFLRRDEDVVFLPDFTTMTLVFFFWLLRRKDGLHRLGDWLPLTLPISSIVAPEGLRLTFPSIVKRCSFFGSCICVTVLVPASPW